jgi:diguanylate cyclase (GGDEF)-like protein/PAS domain S-box-containing protein
LTRQRESDRLLAILDESPIGVSISRRADGVIILANRTFATMIGEPMDRLIGSLARQHYVDDAQRHDIIRRLVRQGYVDNAEAQFRRADGSLFWALLTLRSADIDGERVNLAWIYDITARKCAERDLLLAAKVFDTANEGIVITDGDATVQTVNAAFTAITGYSADEAVGRPISFLDSGRHGPEFFRSMWESLVRQGRWQGEIWNRRKNGEIFVEWLSIAAVRDAEGGVSQYLGIFSDITARKEDEEHMWHQANYDVLTGLPNRSLFNDRLATAVRQANRDSSTLALLFIDLDGFKSVNDEFGHASGDVVLQETGVRLASTLRNSDTVARLSGDEFTILIERVATQEDIAAIAAKIIERLSCPFVFDNGMATVHASVGIALYPDDGEDAAGLMKAADSAMYAVKRAGKNGYRFASDAESLAPRQPSPLVNAPPR